MLIKVKFLKNGTPSGRDYTYRKPEGMEVATGDEVILPGGKHGLVVAVDVPENEVEAFKDKIKYIEGKSAENKEEEQ